jgi:hypothetical protein
MRSITKTMLSLIQSALNTPNRKLFQSEIQEGRQRSLPILRNCRQCGSGYNWLRAAPRPVIFERPLPPPLCPSQWLGDRQLNIQHRPISALGVTAALASMRRSRIERQRRLLVSFPPSAQSLPHCNAALAMRHTRKPVHLGAIQPGQTLARTITVHIRNSLNGGSVVV